MLFVDRAQRTDKMPIAGGGSSDIYRGELDGQRVALKVLRAFNLEEATRKVHNTRSSLKLPCIDISWTLRSSIVKLYFGII